MIKFTEREREWIREYFKAEGNATEAIRKVYGGTPGACRVKGWKKSKKFMAILKEIKERKLDRMEYHGISGIDFYLGNLERQIEQEKQMMKMVSGKKMLRLLFADLDHP